MSVDKLLSISMVLLTTPVRAELRQTYTDDEREKGGRESTQLSVNGHNVPVHNGVALASQLAAYGTRLYDPGFAHTLACKSSITYIDGLKGVLRHRGYGIESLSEKCEYGEVAYLLLFGQLPSAKQYEYWLRVTLREEYALHENAKSVLFALPTDAHPMGVLLSALGAMGTAYKKLNPVFMGLQVYAHQASREAVVATIMSSMPALVAALYRRANNRLPVFLQLPVEAAEWSYARRLLYLMGDVHSQRVADAFENALDTLLIVHADHEQNCSTATLRQLTSAGVDAFSALAGAVAALYGPLHGGASESVLKMLQRIGSPHRVPEFLERVKARKEKLMGFGHRVYRNYDPRARIVYSIAHEVFDAVGKQHPLVAVAKRLESAALADKYFVQRKLFPNVDFYSGLIYSVMGFSAEFFPVLFALGRSAGWLAHWLEFLDDSERRIARPHQIYTGPGPKEVVHMSKRADAESAPTFQAPIQPARL